MSSQCTLRCLVSAARPLPFSRAIAHGSDSLLPTHSRAKTAYFRVWQDINLKLRRPRASQCGIIVEVACCSLSAAGVRSAPFQLAGPRRFACPPCGGEILQLHPTLASARARRARDTSGLAGAFGTTITADLSSNTPRGGTGACPGGTLSFHHFGLVHGPPQWVEKHIFLREKVLREPRKELRSYRGAYYDDLRHLINFFFTRPYPHPRFDSPRSETITTLDITM